MKSEKHTRQIEIEVNKTCSVSVTCKEKKRSTADLNTFGARPIESWWTWGAGGSLTDLIAQFKILIT